jgi:hypothetical protein
VKVVLGDAQSPDLPPTSKKKNQKIPSKSHPIIPSSKTSRCIPAVAGGLVALLCWANSPKALESPKMPEVSEGTVSELSIYPAW